MTDAAVRLFVLLSVPSLAVAQGVTGSDSAFRAPIEVMSQGTTLRADMYVAAGPGPHPTIVAFKGFPGGNSPALSRFLQAQGFNAISVNFRGQNESDGLYTVGGTAADAAAVIAFLRTDSARRAFRVDTKRLSILGTSAGSWATLRAAADDPSLQCLALVVPFNWTFIGIEARSNGNTRAMMEGQARQLASRSPSPVRLPASFVTTLIDSAESFDLRQAATRLPGRRVLMVGAQQDSTAPIATHFGPVLSALRNAPVAAVRDTIFDDEHNMSASSDQVFALVARWMSDCQREASR